MSNYFKAIDHFAASLARRVIQHRWLVLLLALLLALGAGIGAGRLEFSTNYRVFFSDANPELQAFENLQDTYTRNDNFLFVLEPTDGQVFSRRTMDAVERLTAAAWNIPFAIRVDSLTNFQHTYAPEDDLVVEDLVKHAQTRKDVADYAECAAAQYTLIRGYGFARHVRTNVDQEGGIWRGDAVYTISPSLPRGIKTIDAEVVAANCVERGIPTV